jgi:hypothetical protein
MKLTPINAPNAPAAAGGYAQAMQIDGARRLLALGSHAPALTVIITGIFDLKWLLEIEAIATQQ